jgi:hypothetical protein
VGIPLPTYFYLELKSCSIKDKKYIVPFGGSLINYVGKVVKLSGSDECYEVKLIVKRSPIPAEDLACVTFGDVYEDCDSCLGIERREPIRYVEPRYEYNCDEEVCKFSDVMYKQMMKAKYLVKNCCYFLQDNVEAYRKYFLYLLDKMKIDFDCVVNIICEKVCITDVDLFIEDFCNVGNVNVDVSLCFVQNLNVDFSLCHVGDINVEFSLASRPSPVDSGDTLIGF